MMLKVIEKCEVYKARTVNTALEKAKADYYEAERSYNDSGYDRYWNKMQKLEAEIEELESYLQKDKAIQAAVLAKAKADSEIAEIKKTLKNKLFYLLKAIPECSEGISLQKYLDDL